ncbi:hypothetical protein JR552_001767 [Listeria monocytogenes serotype 1/2b]|uniref:hypothetical protein n=1 Tax=Listeria seeligeri TaxID=1640 RepID=UPI0022EBB392|nr:hypothetical protein [Listeria seeligeri]EHC6275909.1 hypothetical protein [Listeria monocytogenes serotype 1/2b]
MVYNYATKNTKQFDQKMTQETLTSLIETPEVDWTGARSFIVTTLSTTGYKPHTRDKGYNSGAVANDKETYTLDFDRDIEFFVDKADVDETNEDLAAANVTGVFIAENAGPEVDAYRFSKMATSAIANSHSSTTVIAAGNVYSELKSALLPIRKYGVTNIIIYVSSATMDALERSTEFTRQITNQNVGLTALESRVTSLDGVLLVEVWDTDRFATKFNFTNGFAKATDGYDINFLIVAKPAVVAKTKFNSIYLFPPGSHTEGDGYLYQNRLYHDLFVMKNKGDGLFVNYVVPAP